MDIDSLTGLPELPVRYFWQIDYVHPSRWEDNTDLLVLRLMDTQHPVERVENVESRGFFGRRIVTSVKSTTLETRAIFSDHLEIRDERIFTYKGETNAPLLQLDPDGSKGYKAYATSYHTEGWYGKGTPRTWALISRLVTPELILEKATRLHKQLEAQQAAERRDQMVHSTNSAFVGNYPPKKVSNV